MDILIALLLTLALITLLGHGIWIALAAIYKALIGGSRPQSISINDDAAARARHMPHCAGCGAILQIDDRFCAVCGLPGSDSGPMADLVTTARQLDRFLNQGRLDIETHKLLIGLIEEERARLYAPVHRAAETLEPVFQPAPPVLPESKDLPIEKVVEKRDVALAEIPGSTPVASPAASPVVSEAAPVIVAETPRRPRRSFTEALETFMEESSVRWGELVGGLLIIGCSIALVASLWAQISARPFLKFSVFIGVTTTLFGLGFYSAHRWKLPTTSRGVLVISTLLAPLNFLAMTAFSRESIPPSLPVVCGELFSLALFSFLVYQAAKVFLPESPWTTALATMGPSLAMSLARYSSAADGELPRMILLGVAPLICYCASSYAILRDQSKRAGGAASKKQDEGGERGAGHIFTHLGIASFASLPPLALLFIRPGYVSQTLRQFAPFISVFGIPSIATGVALLQWPEERQSGKIRTAATSAVLIGSLISLAALGFAWPNPAAVVVTALINCAAALAIALVSSTREDRYDLRLAHAGAITHFSLALLTVSNLFSRNVSWGSEDGPRLLAGLFSKTSGYALALLFALLAAVSEGWLKKERKIESRIYGMSAVTAGAFGLTLITAHGAGRAGDPYHAAPVYAFYAIAAFVIAWRRGKVAAAWVGSALSSLAVLQTLAFKFGQTLAAYHPVRLSFLVFANLAVVAAVAVSVKNERARKLFASPFACSALISSMAVAPFLIFEGGMTTAQISTRLLWLAAIWLVIVWLRRSPVLFAAFQSALAASVVFKTADLFGHQWPRSFAGDLRTMQAQAVALAVLSLAWIAVRLALKRFGAADSAAAKLLYPQWLGVDRAVTLLLLAFLVGLSLCGVHAGMFHAVHAHLAPSTEAGNFVAIALGAGSWSLLAALFLVFTAGLWERFEKRAALAMLILLACACLLIAGRWGEDRLSPMIYRWLSAVAFAAVSLLIVSRNRIAPWLKRFGWPQMEERAKGLPATLRMSSLALFAAPVLLLSLLSFFNRIILGGAAAYPPKLPSVIAGLAAPLLIVGLSFAALSIRERSAAYACAAGLMVNLSVTIGCLLWASMRVPGVQRAEAYTVAQLNIIATSICSFVWILFHRRQIASDTAWPRSAAVLSRQTGLALFLSLSALGVAVARIFIDPWTSSALVDSFGGLIGVLAVALPMLAYARLRDLKLNQFCAEHPGAGLVIVGALSSCLASRRGAGGWGAYHTMAVALSAAAWLMLALRRRVADQRSLLNWITALALAVVVMGLRGVSAPGEPWWTAGFSVSTCLLFAGLSLVSRSRGYIYIAAPVLNYAATRIYFRVGPESYDLLHGLVSLNASVLALPAIAWLAIDLKTPRKNETRAIRPFHRVAAPASLLLLGFTLLFQLMRRDLSSGHDVLDWIALASVAALFAVCLWDEGYPYALCGLHVAGLIAAAMALLAFNPEFEALMVGAVAIQSLYTLAPSALWRAQKSLSHIAAKLRMPSRRDDLALLNLMNASLNVATYAITFVIVLNFESLTKRMIAATSTIVIPISLALLRNQSLITARPASDNDPSPTNPIDHISAISPVALINLTAWASFLTAVLWGWAWLAPVKASLAIDRLAVVMTAVWVILIGCKFVIRRKPAGAGGSLLIIGAIGLAALAAVLGAEAWNYSLFKAAGARWWVVIAVFAVLVSLFCACMAFALSPKRDPFNFSERGRMNYVYGAEALTIVTMLHARLTMPWFFSGFALTWWPLIVMLLAFTGVWLGELFRRRGKLVLAEPLERTGVLLPILPVVGFWVADSQISYSNLLFLVGLFYGALSVMRRSFRFGVLAAFAGNGGLWNKLDGAAGYGFYEHPQMWLIPVSVSVLVAAHVNRERLTKDQTTLIRYTTLMMIYVSSAADIFINGVSESLWLTIVLTLLSVAGVFVGLMLRIRAFLFLGAAFLTLSLLAMTLTALVNLGRAWLWLVAGIAFGVVIIVIFALLEKKRREMLELVERLKQWQA